MSYVSLVEIPKGKKEFKEGIKKSLNLIEYTFDKDIKNVVIKPNLCYYWDYTTGETTDPNFIGALIELIREEINPEVKISIIESDASAMKCRHSFKFLGYGKLAQKYDVELVNLSKEKGVSVEINSGGIDDKWIVPNSIINADLRINVPKIKYTMDGIWLTCALKNIFGCNPYPRKFEYHSNLGKVIVSIAKAIKFDLCIVDGNLVSGIKPKRLGLIMASQDPVATDVVAAEIAGLNYDKIKYIKQAKKEGLGDTTYIIKGSPIEVFKEKYPKKNLNKKILGFAYKMVVLFRLEKRLGLK